jgi:hypothetical protein
MEKHLSIVLSRERKDFRKLAQEWFGLTEEEMEGMHVHHNPPRHKGGRNIPEHLFVLHPTLHAAVHQHDFVLWATEGGRKGGSVRGDKKRKGGEKARDFKLGMFSPEIPPEVRRKWNVEAGKKGAAAQPHETRVLHGKRLAQENAQFEDPDHPELGRHNAGNLVQKQKAKGLPHGKENRRRVQ